MSESPDAPAADAGPLSIDQAVEQLIPKDEAPAEAEDAPEPEISEASPEAEDPDAAETPSEEGEDEVEAAPAVEAPHFWAAEDKEAFAKLSPDLQAIVLKHEEGRVAASNKAIQEARESQKRADEVAAKAAEQSAKLEAGVTEWETRFATKWPEKIDWAATLTQCVEQFGAEQGQLQYLALKEQHEADASALAAAKAAKREAEGQAFQTFVQAEFEKLKTVEPELADPKQGAERRQAVTKFLLDMGVPAEQVRFAGAVEYSLAYDAMRYRQGLAKATAALKATPKAVPAGKAVAPAAAQPGSPQQRSRQSVQNAFNAKPDVDNAVALLMSKAS